MLELMNGRPADEAGRLEKEIRTYDFLDSLGVEFCRVDHAPAMTMDVCEDIDKALNATICKNLFLCNRQETDFYLLMIPGSKSFKTKELSTILGVSRLSFADESYMEKFLDITPGSVSVMGLMNDKEKRVKLLIDEDVLKGEYFGCHPCINTSSLKIKTEDLIKKILPALNVEPVVISFPKFEFRAITPEEAGEAAEIEQICFPPNEACTPDRIAERTVAAPDLFLVAVDKESGRIAGFLNGLATRESKFRDEFFVDINLHDKSGKNVMLLGLDVRPEYRMQGLARAIVAEYAKRQKAAGRRKLILTCLDSRVDMYLKFGFRDEGKANSVWGGEEWHEMTLDL